MAADRKSRTAGSVAEEEAERLYAQGTAATSAGRREEAERLFAQGTAATSAGRREEAERLFAQGTAAASAGRREEAERLFAQGTAAASAGRREEAERLYAQGTAATSAGRPALAARRLRRGLNLLADGDPLAGRMLISLAHAEAEQGHTQLGLNLLATAEKRAAPADRPVARAQRGLMLLRLGRTVEALRELDAAVPELARYDAVELARILLNRAVIHIDLGRIAHARDDLRRSAQLARAQRHEILTVKALHNDGYCDLLVGDIPSCLAVFAEVEPTYRRLLPGLLPLLALDQARALLSAGLATEAGRRLDDTLPQFRRQRLIQDYAEAELARARAALDAGNPTDSITWSRRAESHFRRRGSLPWALRATLMRLHAEFTHATRTVVLPPTDPLLSLGLRPTPSAPLPPERSGSGSGVLPPTH
ncbi:hypothetical protein, partial [Acrocarpospora macrocephala]|uniref:hypothetical protein n=1 Tax=Acrocarpospora macrocephala TaxID=150177 RepID=UPI0031E2B4DA